MKEVPRSHGKKDAKRKTRKTKEVDKSDVKGCHNKKLHNITKPSGRGGAHVHGERFLGDAQPSKRVEVKIQE